MKFASLLAALSLATFVGTSLAAPDFAAEAEPYFQKYCIRCHSAEKQEGEFRIDQLSRNVGQENTPQWAEIIERINSGEMPPEDADPLPTANESAAVVEWLAASIKEGQAARMAQRNRVSYNRLTRDEYVNTVRDLIGVQFDATDPGGFLDDPEWQGFERIGSVLTLSPSNIEKYLAAAETILAEAYPEKEPPLYEGTKRAVLENQVNERYRERLREQGLLEKVRFDCWPGDVFRYSNLKDPLPEAGIYEISYTLSGLQPPHGRAPRLKVYEEKLDRVLHIQGVVAPEDAPTTVTFRTHLPKGRPQIMVYNDVPGPSNLPRSGRHGNRPFLSIKDGRMPWQLKLTDEQGQARYPFLIIDSISWRGPIITEEEQQRRDDYMPSEEGDLTQVRAGLERLARRAFRRPTTKEEIDGYVGIVQAELDAKEKFKDAVKAGMLAILCSKSFLFISEGDESAVRNTLNDWEIASRLSYLLWSTMPDEELFSLAEQGKLRDKSERARQVARMLQDPRAKRFTDAFATQWLRLRKVGMFPPDKELYPEYDDHLEASMIDETKAFFAEVVNSGLTSREFIHSDWSMMNARLAEYYGLPNSGLAGDTFQRVSLPADSHRGGLLTQAAILSLTSDGTRHRPVHRGVWVMESIFGRSPPPPPANVDPIEPNPVTSPKATLRIKLEAHQHDARCASCHKKIDPLGLAFENYDAIGRWRTHEKTEGTGADPEVDPSGVLPDGRSYKNADEFKQLLLADLDAFQATFLEKLATYGLRRTVSFEDREQLAVIAKVGRENDYRVKDMIEAFVTSDLFESR